MSDSLNAAPLHRVLFIDHCIDVGRVENVHFWPFWGATGGAAEYRRKHGKAFIIGRTDWQHLTNCFCIDYETGFQFIACTSPAAAYPGGGNAHITGGGADGCNCAVHVLEMQGHRGQGLVNSQIHGHTLAKAPTKPRPPLIARGALCGAGDVCIGDRGAGARAVVSGVRAWNHGIRP